MSSSPFRRLPDIFISPRATASSLWLKTVEPTQLIAAFSTKTRAKDPLHYARKRHLILLVKKFKKACESSYFRSRIDEYEKTVWHLAVVKQFSYIEDILEHQKKYDNITEEGFTVRLISLYGKAGMFDKAYKLFDEMPQLKCERTIMSFNALLDACVNSKKFDKIGEFFRDLPDKLSIVPDTASYNTVIKGFCMKGYFDSALMVINKMEKNGLEPDLISFNTLLAAFYKNNLFSEAEKLWDVMETKNLVPNSHSYNSKLRALVADNRLSEAIELFKEMGNKGVKPDSFSFNAMIKGFVDDGNMEETKKWYIQMLENNCVPDWITYQMLIPFAIDKLDFEFAFELCKKAINEHCIVQRKDMQHVVDALVKELNFDEAKELVELGKSCPYYAYNLKMPKG